MKFILAILCFFIPRIFLGQQVFTLQTAIDSALKSNYDIQIAKNNAEITRINNSYGAAGALPYVNVSVSDNASLTNIDQKLNSGSEINKNNVTGNTLNAGINAGITLFNGFKIIATKSRLDLLQKQSELLLNQQIQNIIAAVMVKYYDIIRQMSYVKIIQASLEVSKQKLEIVTQRKNIGMANDADFLQAQIDVNTAQQNINTQNIIIEQAKTDLLQITGVKNFISIEIKDSILIDKNIQKDSILSFLNKNPQYLSADYLVKINEQIVKEISAQRYPSVKINTGYNFNLSNSSAGQYLYNQNYGPSVGVTLNIPIFNGNIYKTQKETAVYNVTNAKLQMDNLLNSMTATTLKTYMSYSNTLQQLVAQKENMDMSSDLVKLIMKKFQLSQATILDVKTAQASYENTSYQMINLLYAAKIAEIELKRMTFSLGK